MKNSKLTFLSVLILGCALMIGCSTTTTAPATDGSTLIVTPDTVRLSRTDSVKTLDLKLSCGCGFTLKVTSFSGDNTTIKYIAVQPMTDTLGAHTMSFNYSPSSAPSGTHTLKLNFQAHKQIYDYTNSVVVVVN